MKKFIFYILIAFAAIALAPESAFSQEVEGTVTEAGTDQPLPGVNIVVKGTQQGTATDSNGQYSLTVPSRQDTLVFSFIGYQQKEIPIGGRSTVNVVMEQSERQLEEVVVSGYQRQQRETSTGAVSVADVENVEDLPTSNVMKSLQGNVPGLTITADGRPSGDGTTVRIRGSSTLNNNNPLYVIDGTPTKESAFEVLNPADIASIQVLKSAPAASIYGSRASNGVIVVETKEAGSDELTVNFSSKVSLQDYNDEVQLLGTKGRAQAQWRALVNDGSNQQEVAEAMPNVTVDWERRSDGTAKLNGITIDDEIVPGVPAANTDWQDVLTRRGVKQNHSISASVGGENSTGFMSLNVLNDRYISEQKKFRRVSGRINTSFEFFDDRLMIGEHLLINNDVDEGLKSGGGYSNAFDIRPMIPVRLPNGEFSGPPTGNFADVQNPLQVLTLNKDDQHDDLNIFGNVFADFQLTDNIVLSSHAGIDWDNRKERDIDRRYQAGFMQRDPNVLKRIDFRRRQLTFNQTVEYSNGFGSSNITALVGGEIVDEEFEMFRTRTTDFEVQSADYLVENAAQGTRNASGTESEWTLLSGFSKVDYSYQDKYLLSGTVRYDGSTKLGENSRWGLFPAISAGWRLGQEGFIQDNLSFVSRLKIRGEWGKTGNQDIDPEAQFTLFRANYGSDEVLTPPWARGYNFASDGTAYDIEGNNTGSLPSGFIKAQTGNKDLRWEEASEVNVGLDFGFLDNRITGNVNYFSRKNEDILIQPPFLAILGEGGDRFVNGATVEVNGLELTTTYDDNVGAVDYSVTGNLTTINDEITELPDDVVDAFPGNREKNILGRSQNAIFGYVADGIFDSQQEVDNHAEQEGAAPGRLRFKDLNGDGEITILDQKYLGTSTPDYEFGLNMRASYKNFDARVFLQGVYGVTVIDARKQQTDFTSLWSGTNYGARTLDAWTPRNKDSSIPALTLQDTNDEGRMSTYFAANGRYLKVRNITLGYTFGQFIPYAKRARIFVSAKNVLEFHDEDTFTSPDPEFPTEGGFPRPREFTMGLNLSF